MMVPDPYTNGMKGRVVCYGCACVCVCVCVSERGWHHEFHNKSQQGPSEGEGGTSTLESNHTDELTRRDRAALIRYDQVTAICFQSGEQPHNELLSCMVTHKRASDISKR